VTSGRATDRDAIGRQVDRPDQAEQHRAEQRGHAQRGAVLQGRRAGLDDEADVVLEAEHVVEHGGQRRPPGLRVDLQVTPVAGAQRDLLEEGGLAGGAGAST